MKKLLTFLTLLTLFFGVGWAETVYKTLDFATATMSKYVNAYDSEFNATISDGSSWLVKCFNNGNTNSPMVPIRAGRKNTASVASIATAVSSPIDKAITKVVVTVDAVNINHLNSTKLQVADNANFTGTSVQNINVTITASGEITYTVPTPTENQYYKLVYNLNENVASNGTLRISKVEYYYNESGSTPTTYSVNLNQTTGGTISASPTTAAEGATVTLTATPNPGYKFTSWEVLDGDANEVTVTNNQFTMPASDVEVEATFTALQTYGITVTGGTASPTSAYAGQTVTVTPTIPNGKVVDQITTVPASLTLTASGDGYTFTMPDGAVSVTFTFKDAPVQSNRFERITSTNDLEAGVRYLLVYESETSTAVMGEITSSNTYGASVTSGFTSNNGVIVLNANTTAKPVTLGGSTGAWTFEMDGSLIGQTAKNSLKLGAENNTWAIVFDNGKAEISHSVSSTDYTIRYNAASPRFAGYAGTQQKIYLYKEVAETTTDKLYLIGNGMNGTENWNLTTAPQMTYIASTGTYAIDVYFDKAQRGMFQFAKGLSNSNDNWNGLTGRLYPSTNGSNVSVDNYDMDGTVGLYFTDNSNMYSFELPAGLYTITANLGEWKTYVTQKPVTMTISPNSATFDDTKSVTLASNLTDLGGKIYYTTDDTEPSATNGTEYTGTITLDATTTIKAIAILGYIQSEVVEKTYTKKPTAPVITPNGGTIYAATQVTITAEEGATIYYTTDGSTPSNSSTQYTEPLTVSATTTVKAIAYVGDTYSNVTTAEFTYSNVQPSTGDFVLVTSSNELIAGNEYIIVTTYEGLDDNWDPVVFNYAMGALTTGSNPKGSRTTDFTLTGTIGASGSRIAAGSEVNVLTLGGSAGAWTLKQQDGNYISLSTDNTNISGKASSTPLLITVDSNEYDAYIGNNGSSNDRQILYQIGSANVFGNYKSSNVGDASFPNVYLYTRESNSVQPPVFTPAGGVYDVPVDVTISCATTGASIYYTTDGTEPSATNGTLYNGEEFLVSETTTYKAVAVKNGNTSSVVTAEYTIAPHTAIETVTLDYSEPFTAGIGKFVVENVSGYSPVWTLDGNYGIKGTAYNANTNPANNAAVSRFLSPIIDMTDATQPELTFAYQINGYFTNASEQCTLWIRETTNGTSGTWIQLPLSFQTPAEGDWSNEYADISLNDYAGKKVQISFLYNNPEAGTGAGTWEIQNFVVADNSEYKMVNNIAEFLALDNGQKAKFRNPVTVLYDYSQYSKGTYQEYIWVKDETGFTQIFLQPSLDGQYGTNEVQRAYYENGDVIPAGFIVTKQYYTNGGYYQAFSNQATEEGKSGFQEATTKALADPEPFTVAELANLQMTQDNIDTYNNRYVRVNKLKITSKSGKNFYFTNDQNITVTTVGYNKYSDTGSVLKDGTTTAVVDIPDAGNTYYNVTAILQKWDDVWEIMPISFTPWEEKTVTLRELCDKGVVNEEYTISNPLQVVYVDTDRHSVWVKDDNGQSIWSTSPAATDKNFAIDYAGNTRDNQAYYDQSNWCQLVFDGEIPSSLRSNPIIKGGMIKGTFTNKLNPTLSNVVLGDEPIMQESSSYATNYYVARNFAANSDGYFFMNPKPQEYADIVWAIYDETNNAMIMTSNPKQNPNGFVGSFKVDMSMNIKPNLELVDGTQTGKGYEHFKAIVRLASTSNAPMLKDRMPANTEYVVFPLDITQDVPTGITDVNGKAVKSVKYVNVAGVMSDVPFEGVNIVVTEYTDGSRSTSKMIKR